MATPILNDEHRFAIGDQIEIKFGPLKGLTGIIVEGRTIPQHRVLASVSLLQRNVQTELNKVDIVRLRTRLEIVGAQVRTAIEPITAEAIYYLATHPDEMYVLDPIKFEILVARLLEDAGYSVKITPPTRDGGRDILAILKIPYGEVLTIVDCKRFAPHRRIGSELVQRLLWVSDNHDKASNAMLVTTSSFTSGARLLEKEHRWRLRLKEYGDIHDWLGRFGTGGVDEKGALWVPPEPEPKH